MKKQLLLILAVLSAFTMYAQTTFERGYFINDSNQKVDCLIKNLDWKNNPIAFEYKMTEESEVKTIDISSVKEFAIPSILKFVRATVYIDRSTEDINKLSADKNPVFKEETLFLKVLVEGRSTLYQYLDTNLSRYFYNYDNSNVEQLVYKSYKAEYAKIGKNNRYKQQLFNTLKCSSITSKTVENLEYKESKLVNFFVKYNECNNANFTNFSEKKKGDLLNLTIRPGIKNSNLLLQYLLPTNRETELDFDSSINYRFGLELEIIMPFYNNKLSLFLEPTYQTFTSERQTDFGLFEIDYASIEVVAGLRHYFFINDNSKVFVDGAVVVDNSNDQFIRLRGTVSVINLIQINSSPNAAFGLGYKYNDKYSLQVRYQTSRSITTVDPFYDSNYNTTSLIFGYTIF